MTRTITVIVDGNNHSLTANGQRAIVQTDIDNNIVTIQKCREVAENIRNAGHEPKTLRFMLSVFGQEYEGSLGLCADYKLNKDAYYHVDEDRLVIWQDGRPVYQNHAGTICRDEIALADSLL